MTTPAFSRLLASSLAAISLAVLAAPALAQRPRVPTARGFAQPQAPALALLQLPNVLLDRLGLSSQQKGALEAARARRANDLQSRPGQREAGVDPRGTLLRLEALERRTEAEALSILTPEQRRDFQRMQTDYRLLAGLGRPAVALLNVTELTSDQKRGLQTVIREMHEKRAATLRKLSREATLQEAREALQGVEKETEKAVREKLTSRQQKEFVVALPQVPPPGRYRTAGPVP